ncbi:hypothetical protein ABMA32_10785 [Mesorhizobium sp. VNQ89]|uniref:hypothetical protein n=1 Tax=Mesorhizobium quangtriensis TaxID=3157709 RepID=UPI0032B72A7D
MNPHVSIVWMEVIFPWVITLIIGIQLWRQTNSQRRTAKIGILAILLALGTASSGNLFYQRVVNVRAWPTSSIFDQVLVTPDGNLFVKMKDPILARATRVQLYSCRGEFKAAFQPDSAGGLFKIALNPDDTLSIYSVRTDTIDIFSTDGTFLQRREMDSREMPFEFLKPGPSVTSLNGCEFAVDRVSGQPIVKDSTGVWPLERGDWILEDILNRRNIICAALFGVLMLFLSYARMRNRKD